jgi:EmrB/QacA subfamily drug resistance transporter
MTLAPPQLSFTKREFWTVFWGALIVLVLGVLDQNIVSTASFQVVRQLDPQHGLSRIPWLITAYLLTSTAVQPLYGKLCDLYGPKRVYLSAIGLFLAGSIACGLAPNMGVLIAARAFQGLGAGGLISVSMIIAAFMAPARERGRRLGIFGAAVAIGSAVGPIVGGFIVDSLSWRWIFFVNLPLGGLAFIMIAGALHLGAWPRRAHRLDLLGAALLLAGAGAVLLVAQWGGQQYPWRSTVILGLAAVGILALAAFIWRQAVAPEPIVSLGLFRDPVFRAAHILLFISGTALTGTILYLALYFQVGEGHSAQSAGLRLLSLTIGMAISSTVTGRMIARLGRYKIFPVMGTLLAAVGAALLARFHPGLPEWQMSVSMFILGYGFSQILQPLVLAIQNSTARENMGKATASATFIRSLGAALGAGVLGAVIVNRTHDYLPARLTGLVGRQIDITQLHGLAPADRQQVIDAFIRATHVAFLFASLLMAMAFVVALTLRDIKLEGGPGGKLPATVRARPAAGSSD